MEYYIGVDLGGTNVRVAKVDENGKIVEELKEPSLADRGPEVVIEHIIDMVQRIGGYQDCNGVGIGVPGPVDVVNGCMTISTNLNGFSAYPVVDSLAKVLKLPIYMDNDANVAGLAEAMLGAGKGYPVVYYITHSTGIGGALIVNNKIVSGRKGYAGEVANVIIDRNRKKHNYLNAGAVENEISGIAIARIGQERLNTKTTKDVFDLYQKGHEEAEKIIDEMAYDFAQLLSTISAVCDPHIFVIGGGVAQNNHNVYFDKVKNHYQTMVHAMQKDTPMVLATLAEPGVVGAAMLVRSAKLNKE